MPQHGQLRHPHTLGGRGAHPCRVLRGRGPRDRRREPSVWAFVWAPDWPASKHCSWSMPHSPSACASSSTPAMARPCGPPRAPRGAPSPPARPRPMAPPPSKCGDDECLSQEARRALWPVIRRAEQRASRWACQWGGQWVRRPVRLCPALVQESRAGCAWFPSLCSSSHPPGCHLRVLRPLHIPRQPRLGALSSCPSRPNRRWETQSHYRPKGRALCRRAYTRYRLP